MSTILNISNVSKNYPIAGNGSINVLDNLSLQVQSGEVICIVGPSGCGKSTLLRMLAGLDSDFTGEIKRQHGEQIAYMPQDDALLPWRTLAQNVAFGLEFHGLSRSEIATRVTDALHKVGLADFRDSYPSELSGGMRQRAALARTLVIDAPLYLFDEPLSQVDFVTRRRLAEMMRTYAKEKNIAAIVVTHSIEEATFMATRVVVLSSAPAQLRGIFTYRGSGAIQHNAVQCETPGDLFDNVVNAFQN